MSIYWLGKEGALDAVVERAGISMRRPQFSGISSRSGEKDWETSATGSAMKFELRDLLKDVRVVDFKGDWETEIQAVFVDSRRVIKQSLFFALEGLRTAGNLFVEEAIDRGACAVVSEKPAGRLARVAHVQVEDSRRALAAVVRRFYGNPQDSLEMVGVTGTNGKTTVAYLLKHLLTTPERKIGMMGTVEYDLGERTMPANRTTPESIELYAMLAEMRRSGCEMGIMEVSSHGIEQRRVDGLKLKLAIFLNLSHEHIDYHGTKERYFEVKCRLFTGQTGSIPETAVVNVDDPYGRRLIERISGETRVLTFGESADAEIHAREFELSAKGSRFMMRWPEGSAAISTSLLGKYNVSNVLAAISACYALGHDPAKLAQRLTCFSGVSGRMERIDEGQPFNLLVDYAHTDDALSNALSMLRAVTSGRILVVFGCGGDRDRAKRPVMTRVVMEYADRVWATADNPRRESIEAIFEDMRLGVTEAERIRFVDDRRLAISLALDEVEPGDCLLIAGRGHESFQEFRDSMVPFDDRKVARELLRLMRNQ